MKQKITGIFILATLFIHVAAIAMPPQAMIGDGAPWYIMLLITLAPGAAAVSLTIGTVWLIRRINRDTLKRKAIDQLKLIKMTIAIGALWGPVMQWGLQRQVSNITGAPVFIELVVIAALITGLASLLIYEFLLMPYLRKKYPAQYELLKVRHKEKRGHVGNTPEGDLTTYAKDDDITETPNP